MNPIADQIRNRAPQASERLRSLGGEQNIPGLAHALGHGSLFEHALDAFADCGAVDEEVRVDILLGRFDGLLQLIEARVPLIMSTAELADGGSLRPVQHLNQTFFKLHRARDDQPSYERGPLHPRLQEALDIVIEAYACAGYLENNNEATHSDDRTSPSPVVHEDYVIDSIKADCPQALIAYMRAGADWRHIPSEIVRGKRTVYKHEFLALVKAYLKDQWAIDEVKAVMREHRAILMKHDIRVASKGATPIASAPARARSPRAGM